MTDESVVSANLNTSGGGDVILLQPTTLLSPDTEYRFEVSAGVKDLSGASFLPYSTTFTTGTAAGGGSSLSGVSFEKVSLPDGHREGVHEPHVRPRWEAVCRDARRLHLPLRGERRRNDGCTGR